jgi:predicted flap endonuclease-1-like 5' DNA nuclease
MMPIGAGSARYNNYPVLLFQEKTTMNKNGKNGNEAALVASEHDDLQKISGIGPKFAKALYQIGINSYTDLVQHTPEQLASLLTQQGNVKIAPERIEADHWLEQAQVFVAESYDLDSDLDIEEVDTRPLSETAAEELAIGQKPQEWHQHAGFSLFFDYIVHNADEREWQTRLYHEETGNEVLLEGTDTAVWANWVEKQANLPHPSAEEVSEKVAAQQEADRQHRPEHSERQHEQCRFDREHVRPPDFQIYAA